MHHYSQGVCTKQAHKAIPEGCFEEEQGRQGFFGPVSHLIKKSPSTNWNKIEGELSPHLYDLVELSRSEGLQRLLYNGDVTLYKRTYSSKSLDSAERNADGDCIYFCHRGSGQVFTEYGLLNYSEGDYVVIPKCVTFNIACAEESQFFVIESRQSSFWEPDRGMLGKNGIYDLNVLDKPDFEGQSKQLLVEGMQVSKIKVKHSDEETLFSYPECVFAQVLGWKGDFFPFVLSMDNLHPVMSHRVHLPPSAHTTFVASGFVVCSFLPRPLESDSDALRVPFYHQNIDYDEVLFYHNGDFFSRDNLHAGMMSFHPAGFPHGPHPKAVKSIDGKTHTDEYAVMIDTRNKLHRDENLTKVEITNYWQSWSK